MKSRHTDDLVWVGGLILAFVILVLTASAFAAGYVSTDLGDVSPVAANSTSSDRGDSIGIQTFIMVSFGGVLAAFISLFEFGKKRFSTVDLFGMEILTIIRLFAISSFVDRIARLHHTHDNEDSVDKSVCTNVNTAEAATGFLDSDQYFSIFENNMRELGALDSDVVDYVTAFYTFLKAVREQVLTLKKRLGDLSGVTQRDLNAHVFLILFLTDTLMSCAYRAIEALVESDAHRMAAWRMALVVAAPTNNFLFRNLPADHAMLHFTRERRAQYHDAIAELERQEKKLKRRSVKNGRRAI